MPVRHVDGLSRSEFRDYSVSWLKVGIYERIDDAVAHVLRLKYRLGIIDHPYWTIRVYMLVLTKLAAVVAPTGCRGIGSVVSMTEISCR